MNGYFLFEPDAGCLAGLNNPLQPLQIPAGLIAQDGDTKLKRLVYADAAMAEGALGFGEQRLTAYHAGRWHAGWAA